MIRAKMKTWGVLKNRILNGLLTPDGNIISAGISFEQLMVGASFALTELSFHTACPTRKEYICDGTTQNFEFPKDSVDYFQKTASIYYIHNNVKSYLPVYLISKNSDFSESHQAKDWMEWPYGILHLNFMPSAGARLFVDYYKKWDDPVDDDSVIGIPDWMEMPFCYLVAASSLESVGSQNSNINQWRRKVDSGDPTDNPVLDQVKHYVANAQRILAKITPQDRDRWYEND